MDLSSSIDFATRRARSDLVRLERDDVVAIGMIACDSMWNRVDAYVGQILRCRKCGADFRFSATEQKAWREEYGFSIHSYPIHCRDCRALEREVVLLRKRLDEVLSLSVYSSKDIDELIDVIDLLVRKGRRDLIGPQLKQKILWAAKRSRHPAASELAQSLK